METKVFTASVEAMYSAEAESLCNSFKSFVHSFSVSASYALSLGLVNSTSFVFNALEYLKNQDYYLDERKDVIKAYGIADSTKAVLYSIWDMGVISKLDLDEEFDIVFNEACYLKKAIQDAWLNDTTPKNEEDELPF
jgi:hypothetical protein